MTMDLEATKLELVEVLNELYQRDILTSTGGNISFRDPVVPAMVWIMPGGVHKGKMRPEWLVQIDLQGEPVQNSAFGASSERFVHCEIYRAREDVNAVVHSHALNSSIMAMSGLEFLPISTGAAIVGNIPTVPFVIPGTRELGKSVAEAMGESGVAVFMQNHGLVVAASNLRRATDLTLIVERTASEILGCRAVGMDPPTLGELEVEVIRGWRHNHL